MQAVLKVVSGPESDQQWTLTAGTAYRVGRDPSADFSLPADSRMSAIHFAIRLREDGVCQVRDLDSTNGLYRNEDRIEESDIGPDDVVCAGRSAFAVVMEFSPAESSDAMVTPFEVDQGDKPPPMGTISDIQFPRKEELQAFLRAQAGPHAGQQIALLPGEVLRIGRSEQVDVSLPDDGRMSSVHFAVRLREDGVCQVRDLHSTNGLYMNDERVEECEIGPSDLLRAGMSVFAVVFEGEGSESGDEALPPLAVEEDDPPERMGTISDIKFPPREELQAILNVEDGPHAGQQILLEPGEVIRIGRSEKADVRFPDDLRMSSIHFALRLREDGVCQVRDLQSTNGLYLNGEHIEECEVERQDVLHAGDSDFTIIFEGEGSEIADDAAAPLEVEFDESERMGTLSDIAFPPAASAPLEDGEGDSWSSALAKGPPDPSESELQDDESDRAGREHGLADERAADAQPIALLRVLGGPYAGCTAPLKPGVSVRVGRDNPADFIIAADLPMSGVHFAVVANADGACHVRDLASSNGLFLNGERIDEGPLEAGDELRAGRTTFTVELVNVSAPSKQADVPAKRPNEIKAPASSATLADQSLPTPQYDSIECETGLLCLQGVGESVGPLAVAHLLARDRPIYLIADLIRFDGGPRKEIGGLDYIYHWLPAPSLPEFSPVLLDRKSPINLFQTLVKGWGADAVVCLFSPASKDELLECIRTTARGGSPPDAPVDPTGLVDCCRPKSLTRLLAAVGKPISPMLDCLSAVLLEADSPAGWQIFCRPDFVPNIDALGFVASE